MSAETHYFGAGPAALPNEVKQQIQNDLLEYQDSGVSIVELSHRSDHFLAILQQAQTLLRTLYQIPNQYQILFMAGGANLQFDALALNLKAQATSASYLDTGLWSRMAGQLAEKYIHVDYVPGLAEHGETVTCLEPALWRVNKQSAYLHVTPNETIDGIEFVGVGQQEIPVVADMTSCLLMQNLDITQYGVLYAATQKVLGISGLSVVIIRDDLLNRADQKTPYLMRYDEHATHHSIVNTAPVFACYVTLLMLQWVTQQGGVTNMQTQAATRASLLYDAIDANPKLLNNIGKQNRSNINVVFTSEQERVTDELLKVAAAEGLTGLQGHRSRGGVRASMYNGTPMPAVERLAELIRSA